MTAVAAGAPEIDSTALKPDGIPYPGQISWTGDNAATMQYDSYKVQAVLNWIDGYSHNGPRDQRGASRMGGDEDAIMWWL